VRSADERRVAQLLLHLECNDCEVSRLLGIPRSTVRDWRRRAPRSRAPASLFDPSTLPRRDYAYLLGLYLGDGCISAAGRGSHRLRVVLDQRYPGIVDACAGAMDAVRGRAAAYRLARVGCVEVSSYWKHWPDVFPQHGPGRKHERAIGLLPWQQRIVDEHPRALLRGLIHSDGARFTNRVVVRGKAYAYPRYTFTNVSEDIKRIFCDACDAVGVEWRVMNATNVSVARRGSVALLDEFIGPKR